MAKATKRSGKQKSASASASNAKPKANTNPFTPAPAKLQPFLKTLDSQEIYLVHIDRHPLESKKQLITVPIILNAAIAVLVIYRVYRGLETYPEIFRAALGQASSESVDTETAGWEILSNVLVRRTLMFIFDYFLVTLFAPWPARFVTGPAMWRYKLGFQDVEIVVRQSRRAWSQKLEKGWFRDDEASLRDRIVPAVTPERLSKTGYLLIDADWDLDYAAMVEAHKLVEAPQSDKKKTDEDDEQHLKLEDFATRVLVHEDGVGWFIWKVQDDEDEQAARRDKIVAFKDKLTLMGKENLFFRWVELIQYESTQPGGFTPERQRSAMRQAKEIFEKQGVDFAKFWQEVGGMEGLPGMDQ